MIARRFRHWLISLLAGQPRDCALRRCEYYTQYLAYGPPDMPHETYHMELDRATAHMRDCTYSSRIIESDRPFGAKLSLCPACESFERRLRF